MKFRVEAKSIVESIRVQIQHGTLTPEANIVGMATCMASTDGGISAC